MIGKDKVRHWLVPHHRLGTVTMVGSASLLLVDV